MSPAPPSPLRTLAATALAVTAFAANSLLCRLALGPGDIGAAGFTIVRLTAGAVALFAIARLTGRRRTERSKGGWAHAAALFSYAILFSFAYVRLNVGAGALVLFATVQTSMVLWGIRRGERPRPLQWTGFAAALGGLVYLLLPGLSAPSPIGSAMMAGAGLSWAVYSLRKGQAADPIVATTDNFVRTIPLVLVAAAVFHQSLYLSARGVVLATISGALASGLGYVFWNTALPGLSATRAASVQLTVPAIAAVGGLLFLGETISVRLVVASALILGGVGLTIVRRERAAGST